MSGPTMKEIASLVAERHGLTLEQLRAPGRVRREAWPRQEAMALIRAQGRYSFTQIGRFFNRDHTTVIAAERRYRQRLQEASRPQAQENVWMASARRFNTRPEAGQ